VASDKASGIRRGTLWECAFGASHRLTRATQVIVCLRCWANDGQYARFMQVIDHKVLRQAGWRDDEIAQLRADQVFA
jgi:hypothetical protein